MVLTEQPANHLAECISFHLISPSTAIKVFSEGIFGLFVLNFFHFLKHQMHKSEMLNHRSKLIVILLFKRFFPKIGIKKL